MTNYDYFIVQSSMQIYIVQSISTVRRMFNLNRSRNLDIKTGSNRSLPDCYTYRSIEISQPTFRCKHVLNLHLKENLSHISKSWICVGTLRLPHIAYMLSQIFFCLRVVTNYHGLLPFVVITTRSLLLQQNFNKSNSTDDTSGALSILPKHLSLPPF